MRTTPLRILLIDDSEADRAAMRRALESAECEWIIDEAVDGASGIAAYRRADYDCVLLDFLLPDSNGLKILRRMVEHSDELSAPVVMMTAHGDEQVAVDAMKAGALNYVIKGPAAFERIAHTIRGAAREWRHIEARREAEATSRALNVELERRVSQRTQELATTVEELEAFCYAVSHDLRAPLRAVDGFAEILSEHLGADNGGGPEARECIHRVQDATSRMSTMIDGLLGISRLRRAEMAFEPVDLADLARRIVEDFRSTDKARHVEVDTGSIPPTRGDPGLLSVVLQNLIENAWKFTTNAEQARIEIGHTGGGDPTETVYYVRDNGRGFDPSQSDRLFAAFQRLENATGIDGSGIGLAMAKRAVSLHGGRIWADSAPNEGTTFYFTLPCRNA